MKHADRWQWWLGAILIALSVAVYYIHYAIFRDAHHIFIYLVGDIAFVFVEVLMVTLVIHRLLTGREKRILLKKLNMVIGAFFSEVGTELAKLLLMFDNNATAVGRRLMISADWSRRDFDSACRYIAGYEGDIDCGKGDLETLKHFLATKRDFLLNLLENPNLLEHESFTDVLWAVFHLTEELGRRTDVRSLPATDLKHLAGDITRVYRVLLVEWLRYMRHLRRDYPYLFSLAVRTNPFNPNVTVEVS